ncbi:MAG: hypothetical protein ACK4Z0_07820 [Sphingomonadaceae bacterium]
MIVARAGLLYFLLVFGLGFLLGSLRVLLLAPWVGETLAVILELPIMLAAAWFICRALVRRLGVPATAAARLGMGALAFLLLIAAEIALGLALFARAPAEVAAGFRTRAGLLGLAGQILFAIFPWLQLRARH